MPGIKTTRDLKDWFSKLQKKNGFNILSRNDKKNIQELFDNSVASMNLYKLTQKNATTADPNEIYAIYVIAESEEDARILADLNSIDEDRTEVIWNDEHADCAHIILKNSNPQILAVI